MKIDKDIFISQIRKDKEFKKYRTTSLLSIPAVFVNGGYFFEKNCQCKTDLLYLFF